MPDLREWLETDGLGGYAMGTVSGIRTRRYHALLCVATRPPTARFTLVNGLDEVLVRAGERIGLSAHRYLGGAVEPRGHEHLRRFKADPWPTWTYAGDGWEIEREVFALRGRPATAIAWRLKRGGPARLEVRPLVSGRDHHAIHVANEQIATGADVAPGRVTWRPYAGVPAIHAIHAGAYRHAPAWYRRFLYEYEEERGLEAVEDLWAPGIVSFDLSEGAEAHLVLSTDPGAVVGEAAREVERRRRSLLAAPGTDDATRRLLRAADAYVVRRGEGRTIVAGYPWFTDWGRDTFIAMRGLLLATGRHDDARRILVEWAGAVDGGMLPNFFPDEGEVPHFNSVDASLWYCIVAAEARDRGILEGADLARVKGAVGEVLDAYRDGARHGIRADSDGLLRAGEPGVQLTWMDAKAGDWVVTPRIGKPVEVQALWANALAAWGRRDEADRAVAAFRKRFWCAERRHLYDVVDGPDGDDPTLRPNQLLAVALPCPLLDDRRARAVVDAVEARLWTPLGPRSLDPADPAYRGRYVGDREARDGAYHQGTVWPWLAGPFIEAWVKVRGATAEAKHKARRFLAGLEAHLDEAGVGHISEIADGDAPHTPRGCPFQAWSVGEMIRLRMEVLA